MEAEQQQRARLEASQARQEARLHLNHEITCLRVEAAELQSHAADFHAGISNIGYRTTLEGDAVFANFVDKTATSKHRANHSSHRSTAVADPVQASPRPDIEISDSSKDTLKNHVGLSCESEETEMPYTISKQRC